MAKRPCSELAATVTQLAMHVGARPDVKSLADVVTHLEKELPGITREILVNSINEATTGHRAAKTELQDKLGSLKREARGDVTLRRSIVTMENALKGGTLPAKTPRAVTEPPAEIASLRAARDNLQSALSKSEPALREKYTKQIDDLTQRLEDGVELPGPKPEAPKLSAELDRLVYQRDRLKSEIRQRIDDLRPKSVWSRVGEVANTAKSLTTGYDLSGIGRQGFIIGVGNPARAARAIPQALRAMMRPEVSYRIHQEILNRPNAPLYARSKLYIADDPSGTFQLGKQEESFMSAIARKIPGVAASERAYSTYLNLLRADTFDAMHASLTREGVATEAEAKAIANFINVATGRPGLGSLEGAATALNTVFFSPRYFASRVMYITGQPLMRGTMATRKLVAKEYAKTFIGLGAIYTLAALAGARIGTDSTSSDFGKIIVGDQRIDPLAGLSQAAVIMSRIGTGKTTDVAGRTKPTDMYTLGKFVRSKLSPAAGVAVDLALRKDYNNKPVTLLGEAAKLTIPITYQDILEQLKEEGAGKGTAASLLNVFGINAQNFDDHARR